jgi:hypothetical protein
VIFRDMQEPQLAGRGPFEESTHSVVGTHPLPMLPVRFGSVARWCRSPAPTVGEHNRAVLGDLLGLSDGELASLEEARVIGTRPLFDNGIVDIHARERLHEMGDTQRELLG